MFDDVNFGRLTEPPPYPMKDAPNFGIYEVP